MKLAPHKTLESFFFTFKANDGHLFPADFDYVDQYRTIANTLRAKLHPFVEKGAMNVDGTYLNDHGPEHIKKVILRASELVSEEEPVLTAYEIYLLLVAIQIHDIGNFYGRSNHEVNSRNAIKALGLDATADRIEWDCIFDIAEAHGGKPKDKITNLADQEMILNQKVRKRLLASILKFADELADDRTRCNRFAMDTGLIPEHSLVHHRYSYCLHSVEVNLAAKQVSLTFDVEEADLKILFKKYEIIGGVKTEVTTYLVDEIYRRTFKTHLEALYCMRFLRRYIDLDKIKVAIVVTLSKTNEYGKHEKRQITYDLEETGYPNESEEALFLICPTAKNLNGGALLEKLNKNEF